MTQDEIIRYELAYRLKQHYEHAGETPEDLARRINMLPVIVKSAEEEKPLPAAELCKICAGIGVSEQAMKIGPRPDLAFRRLIRAYIDFCGTEEGLVSEKKISRFRALLCQIIPQDQRERYGKWLEYLVTRGMG